MTETTIEGQKLEEAILAARKIQVFLWGKANEGFGLEEWRRMFRKRVAKIDAIDASNPYATTELKKRLLQTAALAIALLAILEKGKLLERKGGEPISNLPQYAGRLNNDQAKKTSREAE